MNIVIVGLSITSSWGNGHATTYRALVHALVERGHSVLFLERDVSWYAANRDLPQPPYGCTQACGSVRNSEHFGGPVRWALMVVLAHCMSGG